MATIYDVAEKAGVSASTVSLAFNQPHRIKTETKERVFEAAKALNYQANSFARGLAGGRSKLVGFLAADIRFPFSSSITKGIEEVLSEQGFATFIANTDGEVDKTESLIENLLAHGVSGLIVHPAQYGLSPELKKLLQLVAEKEIPVIAIGHKSSSETINHITYDDQLAVQEAVDYLISLGHKTIGYAGGIFKKNIGITRYMGYYQSLLQHGLTVDESYVYQGKITPEVGRQALKVFMNLEKPPTAIVAANEIVATGVIDACFEENISLPDDLSLLSFDSGAVYQRITPAVTSIVMPSHEIGRQAALAFIERWNDTTLVPKNTVIKCELEIRDTTAPPKDISKEVSKKFLKTKAIVSV